MKKLLCVLLLLLFALPVMAQQQAPLPKVEIFGGYQYASIDAMGYKRFNFNGWNAATTFYFSKHVGITADFSGNYKNSFSAYGVTIDDSVKLHTFTFGPTVRFPQKKFHHIQPYAHVLAGVSNISIPTSGLIYKYAPLLGLTIPSGINFPSLSYSPFTMMLGGGVDVPVTKHLSVRPGQFDYTITRLDLGVGQFASEFKSAGIALPNTTQNHFRYSAGVVYRF